MAEVSTVWWSPVASCTTTGCLTGPALRAGPVRRCARWTAVVTVLLIGLALAAPARLCCGRVRQDALIRTWTRALAAAFGIRVRTHGDARGPHTGVLVVSNHVSWLDILLLAAVCPGRMLAKREVGAWPVFGRLAAAGGTIFIDRERIKALPDTVREVSGALRGGRTVVAFPEGSTWCGRESGRYRPAVFQAALDAGVPVQPVTTRYFGADGALSTAPAYIGDDTLLGSLRRVIAARGLVAEVTLGARIPPGAYPDRRTLARAAQPG